MLGIATILIVLAQEGPKTMGFYTSDNHPQVVRVQIYTDELYALMKASGEVAGPDTSGYTLDCGGTWIAGMTAAFYYARLRTPESEVIVLPLIPMADAEPALAACEMWYNVRVALRAAKSCKNLRTLCPQAIKVIPRCPKGGA